MLFPAIAKSTKRKFFVFLFKFLTVFHYIEYIKIVELFLSLIMKVLLCKNVKFCNKITRNLVLRMYDA